MRVYRNELELQRRLSAQCHTLHQLAEATAGVVQWWRRGAATAAAAEAERGAAARAHTAGVKRRSSAEEDHVSAAAIAAAAESPTTRQLITRHPGIVFYSLGELLQLWATTGAAACRNDNSENAPHEGGAEATARSAAHTSPVHHEGSENAMRRPPLPPWTAGVEWSADRTGRRPREPRLRLPTPEQLIRCRLSDAHCPLAVTHPLLLGSVAPQDAEVLLRWLMHLTSEGTAAFLQHEYGRPDASVTVTPALGLCLALTRLFNFVEELVAGRAGAEGVQWRLAAAQRPHLRHGLRLLFEEVGATGQAALEAAASRGSGGDAAWRSAMERLASLSARIVEREGACLDTVSH